MHESGGAYLRKVHPSRKDGCREVSSRRALVRTPVLALDLVQTLVLVLDQALVLALDQALVLESNCYQLDQNVPFYSHPQHHSFFLLEKWIDK